MNKNKTHHSSKNNARAESKSSIVNKSSSLSWLNENIISYILLILLILVVVVIRYKFISIPFERDEGAYSYNGKLLLQGKTPYKDFYEQKFPGIFYFYALMVGVFGDTVEGMHKGFILLNVLTLIFIFFSVKKLLNSSAGIISAITFAIVSLTPNLSGFTVQSEHGVIFFASLGIFFYVLSRQEQKWYYLLGMGLAMGAAFMTKTTGLFMLLWGGIILIIDFMFLKEKSFKLFMRPVLIYSAGALFVMGFLFFLIYLHGSFKEMIYWTYYIPKRYVSRVPFEEGIKYFKYTRDAILQNHKFFWYHGILSVFLCLLKSINLRTKLLFWTLAIFSSVMIVPGFYFYGHYWIQLTLGLAILSGLTFYAINQFFSSVFNTKSNYLKYAYLSIFIFVTFDHLKGLKNYYFRPNYNLVLRSVYGNNPFPETKEIANYINAHSKPEDAIVAMGSEPEIYFYTKKNCPSRHAYFSAMVDNVPEHKEWQREYVKDIEKAKPKFFIFYNHPISLLVQANTDRYVFEWANEYINKNYKLTGLVDMNDNGLSNYVWNESLIGYKPTAQNIIYIYERK